MNGKQNQSIPIVKGWPLLGILPEFFGGNTFEYLKNVMLEYGDLVQLNFGPQPLFLVSHPDYLQRILRDNYQNYRKPDMFYRIPREVAGNGLINSTGDFWLRQRRMIQPYLHRKQLENIFLDMVEAISETLDTWEPLSKNGDQVDLGGQMGEITINTITRTMFGKGTVPKSQVKEINLHIKHMVDYIGQTLYSTMLPKWVPIPGHAEFERDQKAIKQTVNQIIAACRQEKETSASLIQMLMNIVDEESHEQMTEQQLFDEVMSIFVAGNETTATALTWLGAVIQENPAILEKMLMEINNVLGTHMPSFESISRLTYTRQVFMEILRKYTVAPFVPRALNQTDRLGNYDLPANALVLIFYHGVHHNPRVWAEPEIFDPERFTPERLAAQHPFAYVPFSAGPRKCAGDEFALFEGPLILAMMLQRYRINILPNQTFEARIGATMRPYNGVKVTLSKRTSA